MYAEVQDILAKDTLWVPVYNTKEIVITRSNVKGYVPPGRVQPRTLEDLDRQVETQSGASGAGGGGGGEGLRGYAC